MKSALTKWTFGVTVGLIMVAAGIAITTEPSWADSCSGTTIGHRNADCLTATYTNNSETLTLTNECSSLGIVTAELRARHNGPIGIFTVLRTLPDSTPLEYTISPSDGRHLYQRCCTTSGICAITDCDTTDGAIIDTSHKTHCTHINDTTGVVNTAGTEITNGVVTYTPPPSDE